ncbi:hypothetical protein [Effusibacillus consociatus]|uniref:Uncharacterized protein n=1 Tax=Effusibacillus consociatus TaxID=1117041 RepID=A0ABV9Q7Z7_9BACL
MLRDSKSVVLDTWKGAKVATYIDEYDVGQKVIIFEADSLEEEGYVPSNVLS